VARELRFAQYTHDELVKVPGDYESPLTLMKSGVMETFIFCINLLYLLKEKFSLQQFLQYTGKIKIDEPFHLKLYSCWCEELSSFVAWIFPARVAKSCTRLALN
jgi:hypothetical protein